MSVSRNEPEQPRHSAEADHLDALYQALSARLLPTITNRYRLSETEAAALLEDGFYAYLQVVVPTSDPEAWVSAVVCIQAEQLYGDRVVPPQDGTAPIADNLALLEGINALGPKARQAVRLHISRGLSYEQVAAELNVTVGFAKKLVVDSIRKLRALQRRERP